LTFGASNITVTNNSTVAWAAGSTFGLNLDRRDSNDVNCLVLPIQLAAITANGDVISAIRPGVDGALEYAEYVTTTPVITAGRSATLGIRINSTDVTGFTSALTSANCTTLGSKVAFGLPTASSAISRKDSITVRSTAVTAFAEGQGFILLRIRANMST
jgi:hypothetical protein